MQRARPRPPAGGVADQLNLVEDGHVEEERVGVGGGGGGGVTRVQGRGEQGRGPRPLAHLGHLDSAGDVPRAGHRPRLLPRDEVAAHAPRVKVVGHLHRQQPQRPAVDPGARGGERLERRVRLAAVGRARVVGDPAGGEPARGGEPQVRGRHVEPEDDVAVLRDAAGVAAEDVVREEGEERGVGGGARRERGERGRGGGDRVVPPLLGLHRRRRRSGLLRRLRR